MERANKGLVLAKIETQYATDPTPTVADNAIITKGMPTFEILGEARAREVPLGYFGDIAPVNVGQGMKLAFTCELKGSGAAGTVSRYGPLLRACNLTQVINAGVSVVYTPNSTLEAESVTLWFYRGSILHKIIGAVGNVVFDFTAGEIVTAAFEFTGVYAGTAQMTDVSFPSPTHESIAPLIWKSGNFIYNSLTTLTIEKLTLDLGNTVSPRKDANSSYGGVGRYFISQRQSKGTMNPEVLALSTLNPYTIYNAATQANLETKPSGTAGNLIEVVATGVVLEPPAYGDRENINVWDLSFSLNPTLSAGNNEIVLTFK